MDCRSGSGLRGRTRAAVGRLSFAPQDRRARLRQVLSHSRRSRSEHDGRNVVERQLRRLFLPSHLLRCGPSPWPVSSALASLDLNVFTGTFPAEPHERSSPAKDQQPGREGGQSHFSPQAPKNWDSPRRLVFRLLALLATHLARGDRPARALQCVLIAPSRRLPSAGTGS
jgi:hypothetical protein